MIFILHSGPGGHGGHDGHGSVFIEIAENISSLHDDIELHSIYTQYFFLFSNFLILSKITDFHPFFPPPSLFYTF
jgi:hypothetical protein